MSTVKETKEEMISVEYDGNGNPIHFTSTDGNESFADYDEKGQKGVLVLWQKDM